MLDVILKGKPLKVRLSVKGTVAVLLAVAAVALPQLVHLAGGSSAGAAWLPMYAPVLLAGCLLGPAWGVGVGVVSPIVSFGFTSLFSAAAMPAAARLPYMALELAVFGLVSGMFSGLIQKNALYAFPAVICAQVAGRLCYFIAAVAFGQSAGTVWSIIEGGMVGLFVQAAVIPAIVVLISLAVRHERN